MAKDKYEFHKECVKLREKEEKLYPINKVGYNIQKSNSHTYIKYMINIWTRNDYVFKEILLGASNDTQLKMITDKYDKGIVDFYNIYVGISSIRNYIDNFGPKPEFLLTNENIKSEEDLKKAIEKYRKYWKGPKRFKEACAEILENLYYNKRIIRIVKTPVEHLQTKVIYTNNDFNYALKQHNNRLWGYFVRCTKKAISEYY